MTSTGEGTVALTLLLDQIPRNIFRGSPRPFTEFDLLARQVVKEALAKKSCHTIHPFFRHFLYMVLESITRILKTVFVNPVLFFKDVITAVTNLILSLSLPLSLLSLSPSTLSTLPYPPPLQQPLMHSEDVEDQAACVREFAQEFIEVEPAFKDMFNDCLTYAKAHEAVIQKFGLFPHRNEDLGRISTEAEKAHMESGGARW